MRFIVFLVSFTFLLAGLADASSSPCWCKQENKLDALRLGYGNVSFNNPKLGETPIREVVYSSSWPECFRFELGQSFFEFKKQDTDEKKVKVQTPFLDISFAWQLATETDFQLQPYFKLGVQTHWQSAGYASRNGMGINLFNPKLVGGLYVGFAANYFSVLKGSFRTEAYSNGGYYWTFQAGYSF
ncbi:MAG: hypothetical protein A2600_09985 [Candidatus Lambdaproteobacteria bacterium RIFOXYD1_FULL_56_27]|uniref:Outer membrane protein beta-barrel domain-containing protein n=1 Tax=Candidatus Lambdaproteobacteria bacterium RIFOXYD2_FULL_56_26 TaxID=1817773 RepID=A0A1F6GU15_9PROT|nr:MAG: hypothetical protein A2557_11705 [Candidatus Lambdaproteobacteria bacterium RIFOXYD2_FULL_56_26]OGH07409.1 MAG: hypothetical protein A2600_09985 [Candidatus Lambdaproteobacteria bacterium RIFOXYD1_FULL_56_27]